MQELREALEATNNHTPTPHPVHLDLHREMRTGIPEVIQVSGKEPATVIAGLVDVPVIGLPTSTGYGIGGQGLAALLSMLQTCVPGLTVVNVNNGIGAGASAARIANAVAAASNGVGELQTAARA